MNRWLWLIVTLPLLLVIGAVGSAFEGACWLFDVLATGCYRTAKWLMEE